MFTKIRNLKMAILILFIIGSALVLITSDKTTMQTNARANGSPSGRTGAPGESTCTSCHNQSSGPGQFQIAAPASFTPGQTVQITVTHTTSDTSRRAWGFQLTALDGSNTKAGTLAATTGNTTVINSATKQYMNQTNAGTFAGQTGGATWTFNWTAPATNVGPITFYAAGLHADDSGDEGGDQTYTTTTVSQPATPTPTPTPTPPIRTRFDFDADGRADLSVYRPGNSRWYLLRRTAGFTAAEFGVAGDMLAPADFDGDGRTEIAVFRPSTGTWYWFNLTDYSFTMVQWGETGDLPVPADHDGDGKADLVLYRPSNGTWYKRLSTSTGTYASTFSVFHFGTAEDKPQVGDFDGDGKADLAVYRPSNNVWYFYKSTQGFAAQTWGAANDLPVLADFDGDGKTDVAVFRPSTGQWLIVNSLNSLMTGRTWGVTGDKPVVADYDGDGMADMAVFRPSNVTWYIFGSTSGMYQQPFGETGDLPAPNAFVY